MKKKDIKEVNLEVTQNKEEPIELYILCDKVTNKFKEYLEASGIKVKNIYNNTYDVRNELLLEYSDYRLAIVDTGTGKFSGVAQRKELIDTIGIMDENGRVSLFYTDEALKQEIKHALPKVFKVMHTRKYEGTADLIFELARLNEEYTGGYKVHKEDNTESTKRVPMEKDVDKFKYRHNLMAIGEFTQNISSEENGLVKSFSEYL
jgi:hypothetical protein